MKHLSTVIGLVLAASWVGWMTCAGADLALGKINKNADPIGKYEKLELTVPITDHLVQTGDRSTGSPPSGSAR